MQWNIGITNEFSNLLGHQGEEGFEIDHDYTEKCNSVRFLH